ncbi:MAG TPA: hypothetical protein VGO39_13495, partial [Gaiellaceae bacterium]|nr:hypothetical protein [Gaiellaceae bacterium]
MFSIKHTTALLGVAGALALGIPAASGAAITLPGFGLPTIGTAQNGPAPTPVSSLVNGNTGVLGPNGPLGASGPLLGGG